MSAHCENGVTANLLRHYGIELSEAMILGLGSGLFFSYLPFLKMNGVPVVAFRPYPGLIFNRVNKALGVKYKIHRFPKNPDKAMKMLDEKLAENTPVGMVVGIYNLTYFPAPYRFRFNAHNIVVYGKENDTYFVSDPIIEDVKTISYDDLKLVRYAKGSYKPKGKMYYLTNINKGKEIDLKPAIIKSFKRTCNFMQVYRTNLVGYRSMQKLAKDIREWPKKLDRRVAIKYLGSIVRMQEEVGTGGAGFRFMYGAYLQEVGKMYNNQQLKDMAIEITTIGDKWRLFATHCSRVIKGRNSASVSFDSIADLLVEISYDERDFFIKLQKVKL